MRIITAVWRVLGLLTSLSSPECDDGQRPVGLVRPPLPDICPPEVVDPDGCPGTGSCHVLVVDDGRDVWRT